LVENLNKGNMNSNLLSMKDSFKNLKKIINDLASEKEEEISLLDNESEEIINKLKQFKDEVDNITIKLSEILKLINDKAIQENKKEIEYKSPSELIANSILNSITSIYDILINIKIITKEKEGSFNLTLNMVIRKTSLDLLFIMDLTGSMGQYINDVKNNLLNIMDEITNINIGIDINLGFIGYRDIIDGVDNYIDIDFTTTHKDVKDKISVVNATGGGDLPEDVAWAFERALNKSWKSNAKFIIFVADAPGHGKKYYPKDKKFPNGIEGRKDIEESVEELAKNNTSMFCLKISNNTDIMFDIFQNTYNKYPLTKFYIVDSNNNNFINEVTNLSVEIYLYYREKEAE